MKKYLSSDLIKFILPIFISLLTYSIYSFYKNIELQKNIGEPFLEKHKNEPTHLKTIIEIRKLTREIRDKSIKRNILELETFRSLSKINEVLPDSSLQNILLPNSKCKLEVAKEIGILEQYSNANTEFNNFNYYTFYKDLLNIESQLTEKIQIYADIKFNNQNNDNSEIQAFRDVESIILKLYSKTTEILQRENPKKFDSIIKSFRLDSKKMFEKKVSELHQYDKKIYLSIGGIIISSIMIILLIVNSLKFNLFGNNVSPNPKRKNSR